MRLETLNYLNEVAKTRSITKAADKLFLSKSALSAAIKTLEEELEVPLLERSVYGVEITPAGEMVLNKAALILELVDQIKAEAWIYRGNKQINELICHMTAGFSNNTFLGLIKPLQKISGGAAITTKSGNIQEIVDGVRQGKNHLGFYMTWYEDLNELIDVSDIEVKKIGSYKMCAMTAKYSRYIPGDVTEITMAELAKLPMVVYAMEDDMSEWGKDRFKRKNDKIAVYTDNMNIYCQAVLDDLGVGTLARNNLINANVKKQLRFIPIVDSWATNFYLLMNKEWPRDLQDKCESALLAAMSEE